MPDNIIQRIYTAGPTAARNAQNPATAPQSTSPQNGTQPPTNVDTIDDPLVGARLSYPASISPNQTFIRFTSYDYSKAQNSNQAFNVGSGAVSNFTKSVLESTTKVYSTGLYNTDKIDLYVPPSMNIGSYGANWGEASLGSLGSQYEGGFNNWLSKAISNLGGNIVATAAQTSANNIAAAMSGLPGVSLSGDQLIGLTTGLVFNKNEFSTFSSMNYRRFTYSFLFVARNDTELNNIYKILNVFKISMHPRSSSFQAVVGENYTDLKTSGDLSRPPVLKYPKLWTIEYFVGNENIQNNFLPKSKFCGIESMNINYAPNSVFTTLSDKYSLKFAIPAIQMDIAFKELTPLIADEIIDPSITGIPGYTGGVNKDYSIKGGKDGKGGGTF